ncbi:MAG: hypothetical protein SNJ78_10525 [Spirochaetales bacterium]
MTPAGKKRNSQPKTRKEVLLKELSQITPLLAEDSLEFLKHQAEILLHTARIGTLNQRLAEPSPPIPSRAQNPE